MSAENHVIWSNYDLDLDDWRDDLQAEYPEKSEDELYSQRGRHLSLPQLTERRKPLRKTLS